MTNPKLCDILINERGLIMNIYICDDRIDELENIKQIVSEYAKEHPELSVKITAFLNPLDMLDDIGKNGVPDIALLDICMPGILGTDIAKEMKDKSGDTVDIIFLTTSSDFAVEAFSLHVNDYLTKPFTTERLIDTLDRVVEKRKEQLLVPVTCGREIHLIDLYQVLYTESKNHSVEMFLKSGKVINAHTTLTEIKKLFNGVSGFITVGASYIVNLRCVQSIVQSELIMTNGQNIPVPRRLKNEVREQYFDFYHEEAMKK